LHVLFFLQIGFVFSIQAKAGCVPEITSQLRCAKIRLQALPVHKNMNNSYLLYLMAFQRKRHTGGKTVKERLKKSAARGVRFSGLGKVCRIDSIDQEGVIRRYL